MVNKSLEKLMKVNCIDPTSERAEMIRKQCSCLSSVSKSTFEFLLNRLDSNTSNNLKSERPYVNEIHQTPRGIEPKTELLRYGKAIGYVLKQVPQLDATMLVANVDPFKETKDEFYYTTKSLDSEIAKAIKFKFYYKI